MCHRSVCVSPPCVGVCVCNPVCAATAEGWRKAYLCVSLTARRLALLHLLHRADLRPGGCKPSVYPLLKKIHSVFVVTLTSQVWLLNEPPIPALTVCEQSNSYCYRFFFQCQRLHLCVQRRGSISDWLYLKHRLQRQLHGTLGQQTACCDKFIPYGYMYGNPSSIPPLF